MTVNLLLICDDSVKKNEEAEVSREEAFEEVKLLGMEERRRSQREPRYAALPSHWT